MSELSETPRLTIVESGTTLSNIEDVFHAMGRAQAENPALGLEQLNPFAHVYREVTGDVHKNKANFAEPDALDAASIKFYEHFDKQRAAYAAGRMDNIERHWFPLFDDPRVHKVDKATLLLAGMAAHIGGDLGRSVHETNAPEAYVNKDFRMVNKILWQRAYKESHRYVPSFGSKKIQRALTDIAMGGIVYGREVALEDYERMEKAKSTDEVADIVHKGHIRTERVVKGIITSGHMLKTISNARSYRQAA